MSPHLSVVIPLFNESGNVLPLVESLHATLAARGQPFEILLVDDGSTDATPDEVSAATGRWPMVRAFFRPHVGQGPTLLAGLEEARGALIATMDGDGQNDPRDLALLLDAVEGGRLDFVSGWRRERHDSVLRRGMSALANAVRRRVLADGVHDSGCQLRVFRAEVRAAFFPVELVQSFLPAMAVAAGWRVGEIPVRHHARTRGESKYGLGRLWWRPAVAMLRLRTELRRRRRP